MDKKKKKNRLTEILKSNKNESQLETAQLSIISSIINLTF